MKRLTFVLLITIAGCRTTQNRSSPSYNKAYTVNKIESSDSVYLIFANRNDSTFEIVSPKLKDKETCINIKIKKKYHFKLTSILQGDGPFSLQNMPAVGAFELYGEVIKFRKGCVYDLFSAENIEGLCFKEN